MKLLQFLKILHRENVGDQTYVRTEFRRRTRSSQNLKSGPDVTPLHRRRVTSIVSGLASWLAVDSSECLITVKFFWSWISNMFYIYHFTCLQHLQTAAPAAYRCLIINLKTEVVVMVVVLLLLCPHFQEALCSSAEVEGGRRRHGGPYWPVLLRKLEQADQQLNALWQEGGGRLHGRHF